MQSKVNNYKIILTFQKKEIIRNAYRPNRRRIRN